MAVNSLNIPPLERDKVKENEGDIDILKNECMRTGARVIVMTLIDQKNEWMEICTRITMMTLTDQKE